MPTGIYNHKPHSKETKKKIGLSNTGKKRTLESKKKISNILRGRKLSEATKQKIRRNHTRYWLGKKRGSPSEESRKKMSVAHKGEKSYLWKGGITSQNKVLRSCFEYKLWHKAVFERDNYTCIWCGTKGKINADHIKPFALYPELRFAIDNGRTLCVDCHKKTDSYPKNFL